MGISWENMTPRQRRRKKKALMRQGLLALAMLVMAGGLGLGMWALVHRPAQAELPADDALQAQLPVEVPEPEPPVEVPVDYTAFQIPDEFVVGYGLDYDQRYRNLPYIGVVKFD